MGLDMYVFAKNSPEQVAFDGKELAYWRKHPDLHGWFVQTCAEGVDVCQEIPLTPSIVEAALQAVWAGRLPETKGFFFGISDSPEKGETTRQLVAVLRFMAENPTCTVVYQASW